MPLAAAFLLSQLLLVAGGESLLESAPMQLSNKPGWFYGFPALGRGNRDGFRDEWSLPALLQLLFFPSLTSRSCMDSAFSRNPEVELWGRVENSQPQVLLCSRILVVPSSGELRNTAACALGCCIWDWESSAPLILEFNVKT